MILMVTGPVGAGKTEVCSRTLAEIQKRTAWEAGGVLTLKNAKRQLTAWDIRKEAGRLLASKTPGDGTVPVGRYHFVPEGIAFACQAIACSGPVDVLFVDEIGALEFQGQGFWPAVETRLEKAPLPGTWILVVRTKWLKRFTELLNRPCKHVEVTPENKRFIHHEIMALLKTGLSGNPVTP